MCCSHNEPTAVVSYADLTIGIQWSNAAIIDSFRSPEWQFIPKSGNMFGLIDNNFSQKYLTHNTHRCKQW